MMSAQPWEPKLSELQGSFAQMDTRLDAIHADLREMRTDLRELRNDVSSDLRDLRRDLNGRFAWLTGIYVTSTIATLGIVIGFFEAVIAHIATH